MNNGVKHARVAKVTISLPRSLLEAIDRRQSLRGESRSECIRQAVEQLLRREEEREAVERWRGGYLDQPQSKKELGWTEVSLGTLEDLPWAPGAVTGDQP